MKIIFGLGSNLGNKEAYLQAGCDLLQEKLLLRNIKKSQILQNKAMLLPNSPQEWDVDFLNIALSSDIDFKNFPPLKILEIIKEIEVLIGREERAKWAPREIDIDILAIEDLKIKLGEKLLIPHVGLFKRDFFYKTFLEIEPELFKKLKLIFDK